MSWPFSERVADPSWLDGVHAWLAREMPDVTIDQVEQSRIRPWSTQLILDSNRGRFWFKENCAGQSFEPALQQYLARLLPDAFDEPVAVDAAAGRMVTADRGGTWFDAGELRLEQWQELVAGAARIQQQLADRKTELTDLGVPDCSPTKALERFDRLVSLYSGLPEGHPAHLPPELRSQLLIVRPQLQDAAARLAESRLPVTWNHGDLHPANVFAADGGLRLFDLGDSQWAHALEILAVPYGWIAERSDLAWESIFEAYADAWGLPASLLVDDWAATGLTHGVNRSLTWWVGLAEATAEEWLKWGDVPLHHLTAILDQ